MFYILWRNKLCGNWDVWHQGDRKAFGTKSIASAVKDKLNPNHHYRIVYSEEEL